MAGVFVNPFTDVGFKIIFGQSASKDLLITLLNELLAGEHVIVDLSFLDKEDHSEHVSDKGIIYDIYCLTSTGEYIIVEMQSRYHHCFLDRTLYYVCRAIDRQIGRATKDTKKPKFRYGEDTNVVKEEALEYAGRQAAYGYEYRLHTVYGVFLMNFKEKDLPAKFRTDTILADKSTGEQVNPHFRQIYLQFPYFTKDLKDCTTLYEKLIYTLKHMYTWNRMPVALKEQVFARLEHLAALANLSESDRIAYDKALDSYLVGLAVEATAREEGWREGREKGMEEGRKEGMEEGRKEGMEKGREEGRKDERKVMAVKLKAQGVAMGVIAAVTGLMEEEIAALHD